MVKHTVGQMRSQEHANPSSYVHMPSIRVPGHVPLNRAITLLQELTSTPAVPADPEGIYRYHNFPQYIAEQQSLVEFGTWIHGKAKS